MELNTKPDPPSYTPTWLNLALGVIGLLIVWSASHSWVAVLGGFIAALHITVHLEEDR